MELREFIEAGTAKAGTGRALAQMLNIGANEITDAKGHRRSLPIAAAVKLADYLGTDLKALIAANELVTEKNEARRAFWRPFAEHARAASIALALASVTSFVTPTPAEAAPTLSDTQSRFVLCKLRRTFRKAIAAVRHMLATVAQPYDFAY